jgi:hypothetical protein
VKIYVRFGRNLTTESSLTADTQRFGEHLSSLRRGTCIQYSLNLSVATETMDEIRNVGH